jgi:hypothetical protein
MHALRIPAKGTRAVGSKPVDVGSVLDMPFASILWRAVWARLGLELIVLPVPPRDAG